MLFDLNAMMGGHNAGYMGHHVGVGRIHDNSINAHIHNRGNQSVHVEKLHKPQDLFKKYNFVEKYEFSEVTANNIEDVLDIFQILQQKMNLNNLCIIGSDEFLEIPDNCKLELKTNKKMDIVFKGFSNLEKIGNNFLSRESKASSQLDLNLIFYVNSKKPLIIGNSVFAKNQQLKELEIISQAQKGISDIGASFCHSSNVEKASLIIPTLQNIGVAFFSESAIKLVSFSAIALRKIESGFFSASHLHHFDCEGKNLKTLKEEKSNSSNQFNSFIANFEVLESVGSSFLSACRFLMNITINMPKVEKIEHNFCYEHSPHFKVSLKLQKVEKIGDNFFASITPSNPTRNQKTIIQNSKAIINCPSLKVIGISAFSKYCMESMIFNAQAIVFIASYFGSWSNFGSFKMIASPEIVAPSFFAASKLKNCYIGNGEGNNPNAPAINAEINFDRVMNVGSDFLSSTLIEDLTLRAKNVKIIKDGFLYNKISCQSQLKSAVLFFDELKEIELNFFSNNQNLEFIFIAPSSKEDKLKVHKEKKISLIESNTLNLIKDHCLKNSKISRMKIVAPLLEEIRTSFLHDSAIFEVDLQMSKNKASIGSDFCNNLLRNKVIRLSFLETVNIGTSFGTRGVSNMCCGTSALGNVFIVFDQTPDPEFIVKLKNKKSYIKIGIAHNMRNAPFNVASIYEKENIQSILFLQDANFDDAVSNEPTEMQNSSKSSVVKLKDGASSNESQNNEPTSFLQKGYAAASSNTP